MRLSVIDIIESLLVVVLVSALIVAIVLTLHFVLGIGALTYLIIFVTAFIVVAYLLIINPIGILLVGTLRRRIPDGIVSVVSRTLTKHYPDVEMHSVKLHLIDGEDPWCCWVRDVRRTHLIMSSKIAQSWHEIDIECATLYLFEDMGVSKPLRDTGILVLASIAERAIITAVLGAGLVHIIRSAGRDIVTDSLAVSRYKFVKGYLDMLAKIPESMGSSQRVPSSLSVNALADIRGAVGSLSWLFRVHEHTATRINAIQQMAVRQDNR